MEITQKTLVNMELIKDAEESIDNSSPLLLITWSPNPKCMPTNLIKAHDKFVYMIFSKMRACMEYWCILPEVSPDGRLHYHGWYQVKDTKKWFLSLLPRMKCMGFVKINTAKHYEINNFDPEGNALYYYKKELIETIFDSNYVLSHNDYVISENQWKRKEKRIRNLVELQKRMETYDILKEEIDTPADILDFFNHRRKSEKTIEEFMRKRMMNKKKKYI